MSLRELASGKGPGGDAAAIDIIAVHGLNPFNKETHALDTWCKPTDDKGNLWLRDSFPKVQPNARIFHYEYNSSPVFGASKDSFVHEANQLLDEIYGVRWQMTPIIFIGHSLGGILIKQALVNAWANAKYRSIKSSTYALAFFGTPHSGPSDDLKIGLGKACARVARSMPWTQSTKIMEVLERGTLFGDLLGDQFRHQLEQYKILSCYEGQGNIVPFESAVLNLPGERETQLRINADHENMCRFDTSLESDRDNYRKVERNLLMLCADALVSSAEQGEGDKTNVKQGGIDLSSTVFENFMMIEGNVNMPVTINLSNAPDFAWKVFSMCERSSSQSFIDAARGVSDLHNALRMIKNKLETDTFSRNCKDDIQDLTRTSCAALQNLQSLLEAHAGLPRRSRATWDRLEYGSHDMSRISGQLQDSIKLANDINRELEEHSMGNLVERLDELIEDVQSGARSTSATSSNLSTLSGASATQGAETWEGLRRDLESLGISPVLISEQRQYILKWLLNAVDSGRVVLDTEISSSASIVGEPSLTLETGPAGLSGNRLAVPTARSKRNYPSWMKQVQYTMTNRSSALLEAVKDRNLSKVDEILRFKVGLSFRSKNCKNAIDVAFSNGDEEILRILLQRGHSDIWYIEEQVNRLLHTTIFDHQQDLLRIFLETAIPPSRKHLNWACSAKNIAAAQLILHTGTLSKTEVSPLLCEAAYQNHQEMFELLLQQGSNVRAERLHEDRGEYEKSFRFNTTSVYQYGITALHVASAACNTAIMSLALAHAADTEARDNQDETSLHKVVGDVDGLGELSVRDGVPFSIRSPLTGSEAAIHLLVENGANVFAQNIHGQMPIHLAAKYNDVAGIKALLRAGASISAFDRKGNSALHHATSFASLSRRRKLTQIEFRTNLEEKNNRNRDEFGGEAAMIQLLAEGAPIDKPNLLGWTPLHIASRQGILARVNLLLDHGADINVTDKCNWSPLHCAVDGRRTVLVAVLLSRGAKTATQATVPVGESLTQKLTVLQQAERLQVEDIVQLLRQPPGSKIESR